MPRRTAAAGLLEPGRPLTRDEYDAHVAATMLEAVLEERVRTLAKVYGWRRYHTLRPKGSPAGFPDDVLVRRNRLIFAELKTAKGKTTGDQDGWLADLRAVELAASYAPGPNPIEVYLWRPADLIAGAIEAVLR